MKKTLGIFATLFVALFAVIQPASAQERGDWNRGHFDRGRDRYAQSYDNFRGNFGPQPSWRGPEYRNDFIREREWRERAFREQQLRERERCDRYGYGYRAPAPSFGFQYYGR